MKKSNTSLWATLLISLVFATLALFFAKTIMFLSIICYIASGISSILFLQGIIIMSNNPSSFGVITKWGERDWLKLKNDEGDSILLYLEEGWGHLLLQGFMYGVIPISLIKREHDFPEYILRTPDNATTGVPVGLAFLPNKKFAINYLNLGKNDQERDAMVIDWFDNLLGSELRQWAISPTEGPKTWEGLSESKDETLNILFERVLGLEVPDNLAENEKKLIKERKRMVKAGRGNITIKHLGIDVIRLNLPPMRPFGPVYEASIALNTEGKERLSEKFEVGTDVEKAKILQDELQRQGVNADIATCIDKVMEWKIRREGNKQLSLSAIAQTIAGAIKGGK